MTAPTRSYAVRLEAEYRSLVAGFTESAQAADKLADAVEKAGQRVERAQKAQTDAAGRLRVAEQQLAAAREKYAADSAQVVAAEERSAKARRDLDKATEDLQQAEAAHRASVSANEQAATRQSTAVGRLTTSIDKNRESWDRAGTTLAAFGAITTATVGATVAAAVEWESAWTGVVKTVDGTPAQLAQVEDGLRGLAKTLPATHEEIAAVAEAAGQLGVQTGAIVGFTKVMIDLGETTNLTADEAATSIAQLMNVMGTAPDEVDNLGASLVALGNDGASTERDIIQMAQRIAGAGKIIGLSEGEVMGLANALASVGIEVEAGGSAISTIMTDIAKSVSTGSDDLQQWAAVAGMSAQEFATAWKRDPADALASFIEGLGQMSAAGQDVFSVLDDLGQSDIRVSRALLTMANSGDLLRSSLELGNQAWSENTALIAEAEKRYDTTAAKMQIAQNAIKDSAITVGEAFLPILSSAAEGVAGIATAFGNLPDPVKQAIGVLTGLAGAAGLVSGALLLTVPRALETVRALRDLGVISPQTTDRLRRMTPVLGGVAKAAGVAAAGFAAAQLAAAAFGEESDPHSASQWTKTFLDISAGADLAALRINGIAGETYDLKGAFDRLTDAGWLDDFDDWSGDLIGMNSSADLLTDEFESMGQALATMFASDPQAATRAFDAVLRQTGGTTEQLLSLMPAYRDALLDADNAQKTTGESAAGMAEGIGQVAPMSQEALEAVKQWRDETVAAYQSFIDPAGAFQAVIDKNREFAEQTAEATESAKDSWTDYYDGHSVSASDYIAELQKQVEAQEAWASNLEDLTGRVRKTMPADMQEAANAMIDELIRLGPEGAAQVALLHSMSDPELQKVVELYGRKGALTGQEWANKLESQRDPSVTVDVDTTTAEWQLNNFITRWNGRTIAVARAAVTYSATGGMPGAGTGVRPPGGATGMRLPAFVEGGRFPGASPADPTVDNLLGVDIWGMPRALVRSREWVVREDAADYYGDALMSAINDKRVPKTAFAGLPGFAEGGRFGLVATPAQAPVTGGGSTQVVKNYHVKIVTPHATTANVLAAVRAAELQDPEA